MHTRSKKAITSFSLHPDLIEKLHKVADAHHNGNVSHLVEAVLWKEFFGEDKPCEEKSASSAISPDDEVNQCHRMLLRLWKEKRLPPWVSLEVGELEIDHKAAALYVKAWRLAPDTLASPTDDVVVAVKLLANKNGMPNLPKANGHREND